jgi:hypothetical protein
MAEFAAVRGREIISFLILSHILKGSIQPPSAHVPDTVLQKLP